MATIKKKTGRSADASAGAAAAKKSAAAKAAATKKKNLTASDAASRRFSYKEGAVISKKGAATRTQLVSLKDKQKGITRVTEKFPDNKNANFKSRTSYKVPLKTSAALAGKKKSFSYRDTFGK